MRQQRSIFQTQEQDKTPEERSEEELSNLFKKEFRVMIIKMIRGVFPASPMVKTTLPLQGSIPGQTTRYRLPLHHVVRPKKIKNKEMVKKEKKKDQRIQKSGCTE